MEDSDEKINIINKAPKTHSYSGGNDFLQKRKYESIIMARWMNI